MRSYLEKDNRQNSSDKAGLVKRSSKYWGVLFIVLYASYKGGNEL